MSPRRDRSGHRDGDVIDRNVVLGMDFSIYDTIAFGSA